MSNYTPKAGKACILPALAGTPALAEASADDLRVLLCLAERDYACGVEEIARVLNITLTRAAAGVEYWQSAGMLTQGGGAAVTPAIREELLLGTAAEDAREIAERELKECLETCGAILGKTLNPAEINLLVGVITNYGVSESYLITLVDFHVNKKSIKTVRYIVKAAGGLFDDGIRTDAALDAYIRRWELVHSNEGEVRRLFGFGERALTAREESILARWFGEYGYTMDVIDVAYENNAARAKKLTLAYLDKIITEWHDEGVKTVEDAVAYIEKKRAERTSARKNTGSKKGPAAPQGTTASFDIGNFFESALARSYGTDDKKDKKGD